MPGAERAEIYFIAAMMILIMVISIAAVFFFFKTYRKEMRDKKERIERKNEQRKAEVNSSSEI